MADKDARRRDMLARYGGMERGPFYVPTPPYTLLPSGRVVLPVSAPFSEYVDSVQLSPDAYANHGELYADPDGADYPYLDGADSRHGGCFTELFAPAAGSRLPADLHGELYAYPDGADSRHGGRAVELVPAAPWVGVYSRPTYLDPSASTSLHGRAADLFPAAPWVGVYSRPTYLGPSASTSLHGRAADLFPAASTSRHGCAADLFPAASSSRHGRVPAAGSRLGDLELGRRRRLRRADLAASLPRLGEEDLERGGRHRRSIESLYADAALYFAAAARFMDEAAECSRRARASEDGADRDPELGLSSADDAAASGNDNSGIVSGDDSNPDDEDTVEDQFCGLLECICGGGDGDGGGTLFGLLFGMCGVGGRGGRGRGGGGGGDRGEDQDEDNEDVPERLYELVYIVLALVAPYLGSKLLPSDVISGNGDGAHAWTWFLILYAFVITATTTFISVRVLSSPCCTSKCLRTLVLVVSVAAETLSYFQIIPVIPDTRLGKRGALFSLFHLISVYMLAWTPNVRRLLR